MHEMTKQNECFSGYGISWKELEEIREAEQMEILSDPNEDPLTTPEEDARYEQKIEYYLARMAHMNDEDDDPYDVDPAYDPGYDFDPRR